MLVPLSPGRIRAARIVAVGADLLQIVVLPAFYPGVLSPANNVIDGVVAIALVLLVGWHWAFLPAFVAEMIPFVDLIPTWTAAVMIATRGAPGPSVTAPTDAGPPHAGRPPLAPGEDQPPSPRDPSGA
jgi:hypothetical protein